MASMHIAMCFKELFLSSVCNLCYPRRPCAWQKGLRNRKFALNKSCHIHPNT